MIKATPLSYFHDTFFLNAPSAVHVGISLVTLPIILRSLPVADYGKWQFFLALEIWLLAFSGNNITTATKRGIAKGLYGTVIYGIIGRVKLLIPAAILLLFVSIILQFYDQRINAALTAILSGNMLFGHLWLTSYYEFLIAKKRFKTWALWQIFFSLIVVVSSTVVAALTMNIVYFALSQVVSGGLLGIGAWLFFAHRESLLSSYQNREIDRDCIAFGHRMIAADVITTLAGKVGQFIIGPVFGFANLAVFAVAMKLRDRVASVTKSLRPMLYTDFARTEQRDLEKSLNYRLGKLFGFGFLLAMLFYLVGTVYIKVFLPPAYAEAVLYYGILVLSIPAVVVAVLLHTVLEAHLKSREIVIISSIPAFVRIIFIIAFGYIWGALGVCIAILISVWMNFIFYYGLTIKKEYISRLLAKIPVLRKISDGTV